jgi:8-oxo-dGTP pyrophosphatase MutT (NUDIX family)
MVDFNDALRERMVSHLEQHHSFGRIVHPLEGRRHAAVAVVVVDAQQSGEGSQGVADSYEPGENPLDGVPGDISGLDGRVTSASAGAAFLLCRRSARLKDHPHQWALPGGRIDPGETPEITALRELDEELGLRLPPSSVLGLLDDYPTRSGYVITPVVVWGGGVVELKPSADEVAHAYRIGLTELQRDDSPRFVTIPESDRPVVQVPLSGDLIHAPTGAVLVQFRWVALEGRIGERVDHFEQPVFAWR